MINYMECFDEILSAAEADVSEKQMRKILSKEEIKDCFKNKLFCGDFIALCIACDFAAGINAAKDANLLDMEEDYPESISYFVPLLSGKRPEVNQLNCSDLAENFFGLYTSLFIEKNQYGYNSMLYMFIVGDCTDAIEKFLNVYALMGAADDSLSDFISIAAKRKKTEIIKLFTERNFTVSEDDIKYLYKKDADYAAELIKNNIIAVHYEPSESEEEKWYSTQTIKNWTIKTDIDRIEISGNVYDSLHGLPDGRFYTFEASYCEELNDDEFIVCEKGVKNNNSYILRYDEKLKKDYSMTSAEMNDIFEFCKNNTADYEKIADLLLSDGDSLVIPGIGYATRTLQKGEPSADKQHYIYRCSSVEKTITRSDKREWHVIEGLPGFRKCGREFYMCFDLLAEVCEDIMNDIPHCNYVEKIRKMLESDIGVGEKRDLLEVIFTCLRYYASEENYSETLKILYEYGLSFIPSPRYNSIDYVFDLLNTESTEVKKAAYKRISFRPERSIFSIIPFYVGNMIGVIDELPYHIDENNSKILCWLAQKRDWDALSKFAGMHCLIKDVDLLELALRSPDTVYDFIQNNFFNRLVPDTLKKDGVIKSVDEMIRKLTYLDISETSYVGFISTAYTFFDKKDFEFILSRMPKIKYVSGSFLIDIYTNDINHCRRAYDGKPELACYFDKQFAKSVKIESDNFLLCQSTRKETRHKLTNHRFIVQVSKLIEIFLELPKNFDLEISKEANVEGVIHEIIESENKHRIITAIRHNLINENNDFKIIEYAMEKRLYKSLNIIYRALNYKTPSN